MKVSKQSMQMRKSWREKSLAGSMDSKPLEHPSCPTKFLLSDFSLSLPFLLPVEGSVTYK